MKEESWVTFNDFILSFRGKLIVSLLCVIIAWFTCVSFDKANEKVEESKIVQASVITDETLIEIADGNTSSEATSRNDIII